jgi:hypothetical protein
MVLNKQQLFAPGGKTPEKESVLKKLNDSKAALEQKNHRPSQKKANTHCKRRSANEQNYHIDRTSPR